MVVKGCKTITDFSTFTAAIFCLPILPAMLNSDLVEILALLREDERRRLLLFLESSVQQRKESVTLVLHIFDCLHENTLHRLNKTAVYEQVFPEEIPVANKLEKLMSDTLSAVRQFVASEMALRDMSDLQRQVYLQKFYRERSLDNKFRQSRSQVSRLKSNSGQWLPQDYYFQFRSEEEESTFQSAKNSKKDDLNLSNTLRALDEYYLVERLYYTCILLNQNQLVSLSLPGLKDLLPFNPDAPHLQWFFDNPLGALFRQAIELFAEETSSDERKLQGFVQSLETWEAYIPQVFVYSLEIYACNYGIRHINKNNLFLEPVFRLQKRRVESGRIYMEGKIKASEFYSIVVNGLRLGENAWVKQFIERHREKIQGIMPSADYHQFNLIYYYFQTKEYEPELRTLLTSNYEDMLYKVHGKLLEIKILYEMSLRPDTDYRVVEFLENRVEAAIIFFFREKNVPPEKKKMGKRFADTMKRILHASGKDDAKRLGKIREDVEGADLIADRQWLLKIVDDLLEKKGKK